jgi:hypothetical protein
VTKVANKIRIGPPSVKTHTLLEQHGARGRVETLEGLAAFRSNGTITDEEFAAEKTDVMNSST